MWLEIGCLVGLLVLLIGLDHRLTAVAVLGAVAAVSFQCLVIAAVWEWRRQARLTRAL
jgi:hypothetical protein